MKNKKKHIWKEVQISHLSQILSWAKKFIEPLSLTSREKNKLEVALEEAIVNVISYAYNHKGGDIELSVLVIPDKTIEFEIKDKGPYFDPTDKVIPIDKHASLEERKIGGLGIPLIAEIMDTVLYRREEETNILTLRKNMTRPN